MSGLATATLFAALTAGCQKSAPATPVDVRQAPPPAATLPLSDAPAQPLIPAPPAATLPPRLLKLAQPGDSYSFIERAYAVAHGFGDTPPDYAFDHKGVREWAWRSDLGYLMVVEPLPSGGDRYFYYQPRANAPFYVRDPDLGFGYRNETLEAVYGRNGRPLPPPQEDKHIEDGGRYYRRARTLYWAAHHARHRRVARANWTARRTGLAGERAHWSAARDANPDWQAFRRRYDNKDRVAWDRERYRREAEAVRVDQANHDPARASKDRQAAMAASALAAAGAGLKANDPHATKAWPGSNP